MTKETLKLKIMKICGESQTLSIPSDFINVMNGFGLLDDYNIFDFEEGSKSFELWCDFLEAINIPITKIVIDEGIETINTNIFGKRFRGHLNNVKSIVLPKSLKNIEDEALADFRKIEEIFIPLNVVSIGKAIFKYCNSLEKIEIDQNNPCFYSIDNKSIVTKESNVLLYMLIEHQNIEYQEDDDSPFGTDENICEQIFSEEITIFEGVEEVAPFCIFGDFKKIIIPDSVKRLDDNSIVNTSLREIEIGRNLSFISPTIFKGCPVLEKITVDKENKYYQLKNNGTTLVYISDNKIVKQLGGVIGDDEKIIGSYSFTNASDGLGLNRPDFNFCESFVINKTCNVEKIESKAFYWSSISSIVISKNMQEICEYAFFQSNLQEIKFEGENLCLGACCFEDNRSLKKVILPSKLDTIPERCFNGCVSLTKIALPKSIKNIGSKAFANSGLTYIELNDGLEIIGEKAFRNTKIEDIFIPKSVVDIGKEFLPLTIKSIEVDSENKIFYFEDNKLMKKITNEVVFELQSIAEEDEFDLPF